jgi:penicillin-binding protein 1A
LEPNGAVRAIVGGRDYGASQFNRATDALRQPGSSFKPYVYLTALMSGRFKPNTLISGASLCLGNWCPHNYNNESAGRLPLVNALAMSLNTVAVRLSIEIGDGGSPWTKAKSGRAKIVATARRMGITTPLPDTVSLPLGADAVKVIDQAASYAAFANGGKRVPPYAAISITNGRGDVIYDHDRDQPPPQQVVDPDAIAMMNTMLRQVVLSGTGRRANFDGFPVAGKTGTTNNYHDAWFVGFTGNFVCAVWYGNDDYTSMKEMTGGTLPAATWHELMTYAHQNVEPKPVPGLPAPSPTQHVAAAEPQPQVDGNPAPPQPQRPATLSKASVAVLGQIASTMGVAEMGRATRFENLSPGRKPAEMKRSDRSSDRFVTLQ